jgi:hypothetical protein
VSDLVADLARAIDGDWCVVVARQGRETAAQAELAMAGWSTYLPMQTIWLGNRQRRRRSNRPLFSRYLFAFCNEGGDVAAKSKIDAIVDIRRREGGGSVVAPTLLARLMITEASHGLDLTYEKPKPAFVCGQTVTVRASTLKGVEALIVKVLSEREVVARVPAEKAILGERDLTFRSADLEAA